MPARCRQVFCCNCRSLLFYRATEVGEGGIYHPCAHIGEGFGGDGAGADGGEIDALTGATITSRAVADGVAAAIEAVMAM